MLEQARFEAASHRLLDFIIHDADMREMTVDQINSMLRMVGGTVSNCVNRIPVGTLIQEGRPEP